MSIIKNSEIFKIIKTTLNLVDKRLVEHGERVAYILYKMLKYENKYKESQIMDICMLGIFHDIGAYKTEEIDDLIQFETKKVWNHSIYGYLFIKNMTPLKNIADAILYHHLDYDKFKYFDCKNASIAQMINLADRLDIYIKDKRNIDINLFYKLKHKKFNSKHIGLFFKANEKYNIINGILDREYLENKFIQLCNYEFSMKKIDKYLKMIIYSIDFRSESTVIHTITTCSISMEIAKIFKLKNHDLYNIYYGSLLHDIGKISTPLEILEKPDKLNKEEMEIMKQHVVMTKYILENNINDNICLIASNHHEKLDGTGYPKGLTEKDLSISEQIVAVADIVSALAGKRSYKEGFDKNKIIDILSDMSNKNKISKEVVDLVIENYDLIINNAYKKCKKTLNLYKSMKEEFIKIKEYFQLHKDIL